MPFLIEAQTDTAYKGIRFVEGLGWDQIKAKATTENKYIFVDCYATWCGPCKQMDKNIYPNEKVGEAMKDRFISIKVQFDKTSKDNDYVRSWYKYADDINREYNIIGYPTYLFFSPGGRIVHRDMSAKIYPLDFIAVANAALDPKKQYYTLLSEYRSGKRDIGVMQQLARATKSVGDKSIVEQIVN